MQAIQSSSLRPSPVDPFLKTIPQFTNVKPLRPKRTPFISASSTTVSAPTREKDPEKRVVITGMGLLSVFWNDVDAYYDKLLAGESGITLIHRFCDCTGHALLKIGIRGVTVSDVRGFGAQGGLIERQAGSEFSEDTFVTKVKMEIVVSKDQVEGVLAKIIEEARTGEIGYGKIFLTPISDVIRVRTGERGEKAERMMGGHADMSSALSTS
nr:nitrogen regulatory protein P-II homolog [Solanum lycopersicum]